MGLLYESLAAAIQHHQAGRLEIAEPIYREILLAEPDHADALHLLGLIAHQRGNLDLAVELIERSIRQMQTAAPAHTNLGNVYHDLHRIPEAIASYRRAIELNPDDTETHLNLGVALKHLGQVNDAVDCYRTAIQLNPDCAEAHNNLGIELQDQGKPADAVACFRRAIELQPGFADVHSNLGNVLKDLGKLDEAVTHFRLALQLKPDEASAYNNLGNALKDQGQLDEAVTCYRKAIELKPDFVVAHSNLVYTLVYHPNQDSLGLLEEHRRWNQRHGEPLAKFVQPHFNDRSSNRRLRIGYVSPDLRDHVTGRNLLPLFREHHHDRFEIYCYADVPWPDELSCRIQGYVDVWRETVGQSDEQLAQIIRDDQIDILVDLTLHMARNRLLAFARKPAPVQVTFAGYPGTTGLMAIDYRLTDPYLDPPGVHDHWYSEKSIRLADSFWCYDPLGSQQAVNSLPALTQGFVTFGCLNNFCKVNLGVLKIWAQILKAVERSRMVILAGEGSHRQHTLDLLADEGVAVDRVTFVVNQPRDQYLGYYHRIDIGLDTVPYNGHTTSMDSFWMGVPVVTLVGSTVTGRAGLCQLMNLGLPELIADSPEQYVRIATDLARDLPRLSELRATLRSRMQSSPLMDAPSFARNIESAYNEIWKRWCDENREALASGELRRTESGME